ncbi:hypothetical protein SAMN05216228_11093 [Rhizobium tibeticum]|uniref:Uncharacterized protein n=1 Tax=Rhizobium tibeticum TaxID=501024 RepID=A0ABY1AZ06_9HYPH|nr:hypothetical protein [Rhizobium tibeticum]SEP35643.1 hypothetical protein SAMN05216228_11093 [Rhizobium tibeticum]
MADHYLRYGDKMRIINAYGGDGKGGYLGIGGASKVISAVDAVGTWAALQNVDDATQWTIIGPAGSSRNTGDNVYSGDQITLQNYKDGSYLALFNANPASNSGYPVATTATLDDNSITPAWYILISTANKANDSRLIDKDNIYLVATFGQMGGILDTNGVGAGGFKYSVTGARLVNRDGGSGSWQVMKFTG